jgi:hypothetical protein
MFFVVSFFSNKSESFRFIEKFYGTFIHYNNIKYVACLITNNIN